MNRRVIKFLLLSLPSVLLFSCEKVIDLNLDNAESKIVIEGNLTDHSKECFVYISETQPLDEIGRFVGVSNAYVTITDNTSGKTDSLQEIEKGVYYNSELKARLGNAYTLKVVTDKDTYTATSTMVSTFIEMDTVIVELNPIYNNYTTSVYFSDPADQQNQYLFMIYKNNKKYNSFYVQEDEFFNGKDVKQNLPVFSEEEEDNILLGDTVKVRMQSIDKNVFRYFYSLNAGALGGTGGPASFGSPANPVSNISGDALGYFSVHTNQVKTTIVK